jgi:REP element-mobilizing transposase RayT
MPRPLRIEYEGAYYHVMNRGRGRRLIFHDKKYYQAFLDTLTEVHQRFSAIIHAFCLMGNHYHLLIETPEANLNRIMRHINGVYTQRYNRLKKTDGPLFRGRYKAILVDSDAYLLSLSRYIHRNPIEAQKPLVKHLAQYPWSSYPAYIGQETPPPWLEQTQIFQLLGKRNRFQAYQSYVDLGTDEELAAFYGKKNIAAVLGDKVFRTQASKKNRATIPQRHKKRLLQRPTYKDVIATVAKEYQVSENTIVHSQKGRQHRNLPRKVAMYICQRACDMSLQAIAEVFGVTHVGSVSNALSEVKRLLADDDATQRGVEKILSIIQ